MKLSITFPLRTRSANVNLRFGNPHARAASIKRERAAVRLILDSQLPRLPLIVRNTDTRVGASDVPTRINFFKITITRIGAGLLDWGSGIWGALKGVQDEIAAWLGIGDGPRDPATWKAQQQQCPKGYYLIRIEIEDVDPDQREVVKLVGNPEQHPPWMAAPVDEHTPMYAPPSKPKVERRTKREAPEQRRPWPAPPVCSISACNANGCGCALQQLLPYRRAFYADPLDQPLDQPLDPDQRVLTPLPITSDPPPRVLRLHRESGGKRYVSATLVRRLEEHEELGGEVWIYDIDYTPDGYAVAATARSTRAR